jgi:Zn-dependent membrane protease YugP
MGVCLEFLYLIFQIVTLPIEFEAARLAMDELLENSYISKKENDKTKTILTAISFINVGSYYRTIKEAALVLYNFGKSK